MAKSAVMVVLSVEDAVRDLSRSQGVLSSDVYERFSDALTVDEYNAVITSLKKAGQVVEDPGQILKWIG